MMTATAHVNENKKQPRVVMQSPQQSSSKAKQKQKQEFCNS